MKRETIKTILEDEALDDKGKIDKILAEHHHLLNEAKKSLKTEDEVRASIDEALKAAKASIPDSKIQEPKITIKDDDFIKLKEDFESFKFRAVADKALKESKVKDKFKDIVFSKLEKDKEASEQLKKIKEEFGEFFESVGYEESSQPVFGTSTSGKAGVSENPVIPIPAII